MPILEAGEFEKEDWLREFNFGAHLPSGSKIIISFLSELSRQILRCKIARTYPDLVTFGYFCRKANTARSLLSVSDLNSRFGWGTILHVAPSNIPINFAYSLVMGLLSGNSNIVRLPSKNYPQNQILIEIVDQILMQAEFGGLADFILFCRSDRGSPQLQALVSKVEGLVVWGGDETVGLFRKMQKKPRCIELYFPNRVSSAAINAESYLKISSDERLRLARNFFNDSYLVDQNACSSPSIVFWVGGELPVAEAKSVFWDNLNSILEDEYKLDPVARIDKVLDILRINASEHKNFNVLKSYQDIWLLDDVSCRTHRLRFGTFLELTLPDIDQIGLYLRGNEQTLCYFGFEVNALLESLQKHSKKMVDRIVPIGKALDIGIHWDGRSTLEVLAKKIEVA